MDITIDVEDYKLNVRAAGIMIHNNKVLTHKSADKKHYAIIGGRIAIGEDSATTIKREIKEEVGKDIDIIGYVGTIENFFTMDNQKYHEIMFLHRIEFTNKEDQKIEYTLSNIEGNENLKYEWVDLNKLDEYQILPKAIKEILKNGKFPTHKINIDS